MNDVLKYKISPTVFGICSCIFLLCSWGLSRILQQMEAHDVINNVSPLFVRRIEVLNYLFVFVSLCICVHFVRGTAQLFEKHVWEIPYLLVLWCVPVFNLAVTLWSLISPDSVLFGNRFFEALLVVFSLPLFFCCYFIYIFRNFAFFREERLFRLFFVLLFASGFVYLVLRFCDNVLFPLISQFSSFEIPAAVLRLAAFSGKLSVVVYLFAIVCFSVFGKYLFDGAMSQRPAAAASPVVNETGDHQEEGE